MTQPLHPGIPYWPGAGYGPFRYAQINVFERDGRAAGLFEMPEHMGTHIDAPSHFVGGGASVDSLGLDATTALRRDDWEVPASIERLAAAVSLSQRADRAAVRATAGAGTGR